ncbi:MAG: hypothetical protein JNL21_30905 [Myxococcales bacterium]|nr:hypothetical protein [Myxococcales bacterium]
MQRELSRQLAKTIVDALKRAGHLVLAGGEGEAVVRDLTTYLEPALEKIVPRLSPSLVMGEVTSTFGDEATDEAVEQLVEQLREALLDSDGVEDVYADDRTMERMIFRCLQEGLHKVGEHLDDADEPPPPISVRLDTLGYVAAHAARGADDATLRDALDRAAENVRSELDRYDAASRTAFFRPSDPDPEQRIDIEASIEEELSDLVDLGVVELPTLTRRVPIGQPLDRAQQKALFRTIDRLAQRHLSAALCPGSWSWDGADGLTLTFTPLAEPDERLVDVQTEAFTAELRQTDLAASLAQAAAPAASADRGALALARALAGAPLAPKPKPKAEPKEPPPPADSDLEAPTTQKSPAPKKTATAKKTAKTASPATKKAEAKKTTTAKKTAAPKKTATKKAAGKK